MSIEIDRLLHRHSAKVFTDEKLPEALIQNSLGVMNHAPTSLNSRPVRIFEASEHLKDEWLSGQIAMQTAQHLFVLTFSYEIAEQHIRKGFSEIFGCEENDTQIEELLNQYVRPDGIHYPELQLYMVAGYFSASIEAQGGSGSWISLFDKEEAKKALNLPEHESVGLLFAAGIEKK